MARYGPKRRKTFSVRTQAIGGRIRLVIPGIRRPRRKQTAKITPRTNLLGEKT